MSLVNFCLPCIFVQGDAEGWSNSAGMFVVKRWESSSGKWICLTVAKSPTFHFSNSSNWFWPQIWEIAWFLGTGTKCVQFRRRLLFSWPPLVTWHWIYHKQNHDEEKSFHLNIRKKGTPMSVGKELVTLRVTKRRNSSAIPSFMESTEYLLSKSLLNVAEFCPKNGRQILLPMSMLNCVWCPWSQVCPHYSHFMFVLLM